MSANHWFGGRTVSDELVTVLDRGITLKEADGHRTVMVSRGIRTRCNCLSVPRQPLAPAGRFSVCPRVTYLEVAVDVTAAAPHRLTATGYIKLADLAGIQHVDAQADPLEGDRGVRARATGRIREPDGTWRTVTRTAIRRPSPDRSASANAADVRWLAWCRVITALVGLKATYTPADVDRPFLAIVAAYRPDAWPGRILPLEELRWHRLHGHPIAEHVQRSPGHPAPRNALPPHNIQRAATNGHSSVDPDGRGERH